MNDIVKRLRETAKCADYIVDREVAAEAAAEIERLRAALERILADAKDMQDAFLLARAALTAQPAEGEKHE